MNDKRALLAQFFIYIRPLFCSLDSQTQKQKTKKQYYIQKSPNLLRPASPRPVRGAVSTMAMAICRLGCRVVRVFRLVVVVLS